VCHDLLIFLTDLSARLDNGRFARPGIANDAIQFSVVRDMPLDVFLQLDPQPGFGGASVCQ